MHIALSSLVNPCRVLGMVMVVEKYTGGRSREKGVTDAYDQTTFGNRFGLSCEE
jgi:hypothetical protein